MFCQSQFGFLDTLQAELDTTTTARPIRILGVNAAGYDSDNEKICNGRTLPWLQDTKAANVWKAWGVEKDDVVILDAANHPIQVYNLIAHPIGASSQRTANFAELKSILISAAAAPTP